MASLVEMFDRLNPRVEEILRGRGYDPDFTPYEAGRSSQARMIPKNPR